MTDTGNKQTLNRASSGGNTSGAQQQPFIDRKEATQATQPPTYEQATGGVATSGAPVVIVNEKVALYGPHPVDVQCQYCHNYCRTRLRYKANSRTHLIALLLCFLQLYCCICLPYCINSCMSANHYCGICDRYLATYKH